jgi:predicted amidophosphoribosyltransferase
MSEKTCRDCGNVLERDVRGCPRCAMNFEAENMIDRFIWRRFVPGVIVVALLVVAFVFLLRSWLVAPSR